MAQTLIEMLFGHWYGGLKETNPGMVLFDHMGFTQNKLIVSNQNLQVFFTIYVFVNAH